MTSNHWRNLPSSMVAVPVICDALAHFHLPATVQIAERIRDFVQCDYEPWDDQDERERLWMLAVLDATENYIVSHGIDRQAVHAYWETGFRPF